MFFGKTFLPSKWIFRSSLFTLLGGCISISSTLASNSFQTGQVQIALPTSEEERAEFLTKARGYHGRVGVSFGRVKEAYIAERIEASERVSFLGDIRAVHQAVERAEVDGKFEPSETQSLSAQFKRVEDYLNFILKDRALNSHPNGNEKVEEISFKAPHSSTARDAELFENVKADALRLGMKQGEITEAASRGRLSEQNKAGLQQKVIELDGLITAGVEDLELNSQENSEIEEKFQYLEETFEAQVGAQAVGFTGASQYVPQASASNSNSVAGGEAHIHHHSSPRLKAAPPAKSKGMSLAPQVGEPNPLAVVMNSTGSHTATVFSSKFGNASSTTDIEIAAHERFVIDQNIDVGTITIHGQLLCPASGDFEISTQGIMVMGRGLFECGNSTQGFQGNLTVKLKDGKELHGMGRRVFGAMDGGTIRLRGDGRKAGWQKISETIMPGQNQLTLSRPASDWEVGDRIVIAPTGFNFREAEERIVTAIDASGRVVTVDRAFQYKHYGEVQTFAHNGKSWKLDERAEIANLTRNIKVIGAGDPAALDAAQFGGHMMIMVDSFGYLDGVELAYMGQMGFLGRYPFHWHLAGNVQGQYIKNSSIWNSYQRCVSVHGTQNALLENNVCYNHFGHGFFLENGSETGNSIIGNMTILSRKVPAGKEILISDVRGGDPARFAPSSGFWISNPDNIVRGNVVAGAEGSGFWMSFQQKINCLSNNHCDHPDTLSGGTTIYPARALTREFSNNTAHSAMVGMTWDGAQDGALTNNPRFPGDRELVPSHYWYHSQTTMSPRAIPVFENLVAYKNRNSAVYFRGHPAIFKNLILADNAIGVFFTYNQVVDTGLIVGVSANHDASEDAFLVRHGLRTLRMGVRLYDGPLVLKNVHFANFSTQRTIVNGKDITAVPFFSGGGTGKFINVVRGISFDPQPIQKYAFTLRTGSGDSWQDAMITTVIRDIDGSLTGSADHLVLPNHALNRDPSCRQIPNEDVVACNYKVGFLNVNRTGERMDTQRVIQNVIRSDGSRMVWNNEKFFTKTNLILNGRYHYRVVLRPDIVRHQFFANFHAYGKVISPVVEFLNVKPSCRFTGAKVVRSMAELNSITSMAEPAAVFRRGASVFLRMQSTDLIDRHRTQEVEKNSTLNRLMFRCE